MNVFVLSTGRCATTTFIAACSHITNFTANHESLCNRLFARRFDYAENHIEADNRLSWLLGRLDKAYGDNAFYVHLVRDRDETAASYNKRWDKPNSIMPAYSRAIILGNEQHDIDSCRDYWDTVNSNIELFLKDKTKKLTFRMENAEQDFRRFWAGIGAQGDLERAVATWQICYNTQDGIAMPMEVKNRKTDSDSPPSDSATRAADSEPDDVRAKKLLLSGNAKLNEGHFQQALEYYWQAIELDPSNPMIRNNMGKALENLGDIQGALRSYDQAYTLNPGEPVISNNLASMLVKAGRADLAVKLALKPGSLVGYQIASTAIQHYGKSERVLKDEAMQNGLVLYDKLIATLNLKVSAQERALSFFANFYQPDIPWREQSLDLLPDKAFQKWVRVLGLEKLQAQQASGKGAILVLSHMAAGRSATLALSRQGFKINSLEKADRLGAYRIRGAENVNFLEIGKSDSFTLREIYMAKQALQRGEIFQLAGDGYQGKSALKHEFLGRERVFKTGFAELALMTGVPVFPLFCTAALNGTITVEILDDLKVSDTKASRKDQVRDLVGQYAALLEARWKASPSNISWSHIDRYLRLPVKPSLNPDAAIQGVQAD